MSDVDEFRHQVAAYLADRRQLRVRPATAEELTRLFVTNQPPFADDYSADVKGVESSIGVSTVISVTCHEIRSVCSLA